MNDAVGLLGTRHPDNALGPGQVPGVGWDG